MAREEVALWSSGYIEGRERPFLQNAGPNPMEFMN